MQRRPGTVSLERALSKLGLASRSQTREWILRGKLSVNGKVVRDPSFPVVPETARFVLDGKPLRRETSKTVILYKPDGIVTTKHDEKGRMTVFDILPPELSALHPVGRLDMATTGLLILTNDTKLSNALTDPKNKVPRTYLVTVEGRIEETSIVSVLSGILDNGELLKPSQVIIRKACNKETHLVVELTEGKNREIRRIFSSLGHEVTRLKRISFGSITLDGLSPGSFRYMTPEEILSLKQLSGF